MSRVQAFFATLAGRAVLIAVVLGLVWFAAHEWQNAANSGAEARLAANQAAAGTTSARDAIGTAGAVQDRNQATDDLTRENADAIHAARGADAPVDPAVRDSGLSGLCHRRAYSADPKCLRYAAPARMVDADPGSAAARR